MGKIFFVIVLLASCSNGESLEESFCHDLAEAVCARIADCHGYTMASCHARIAEQYDCGSWNEESLCGEGSFDPIAAETCLSAVDHQYCSYTDDGILPTSCDEKGYICIAEK